MAYLQFTFIHLCNQLTQAVKLDLGTSIFIHTDQLPKQPDFTVICKQTIESTSDLKCHLVRNHTYDFLFENHMIFHQITIRYWCTKTKALNIVHY